MKQTLFLALAITVPLMAQQKPPAPKAVAVKVALEIRAEDGAEDLPKFKRRYFTHLSSKPGLTLTLECESDDYWGRTCTATLRQPDEKSVSFTIGGRWAAYDSIADKIIDPVIIPETRRLATEMHLQDSKYMQSNPSEFKTKDGNRWARVR